MGIGGFGMLCTLVGFFQMIVKLVNWLAWNARSKKVEGELIGTEVADTTRKGDRITATQYRHTFLIRDEGQEYTCYYYEKVSGDSESSYKQGSMVNLLFDEKKEMVNDPTALRNEFLKWLAIFATGAALTGIAFLIFLGINNGK